MTNATETPGTADVQGTGRPATRQAIFAAASALFVRDGYAHTGVREIAAQAGVTPALVIRYFGSKEQLFLAAVSADNQVTDVLGGPLETLGVDLVRFAMTEAVSPAPSAGLFAALMRASDRPAVAESLREANRESFIGPLAPRLRGKDADLRARLISTQYFGLLGSLQLIEDPVLRAADREAVAAYYGAAIQLLVEPPASRVAPDSPPEPEH